jgi:Na+-transporting NADH:ubiquinone oxidoreductase subunit NqrB
MAALMFFVPILWLRITGIVAFLLVAIYQLAVSQHYYSKLVPFYRNTLMAKLVELVNPNYIYSTKERFDLNLFNDSELFQTKATRSQEGINDCGRSGENAILFCRS